MPLDVHYHMPEEEIALGPAWWLWDYVRRSRTQGFLLPLSGGIDSCATAVIVHSMCRLVHAACEKGNDQVIKDMRQVTGTSEPWLPSSPQALAERLFVTCYMGTTNSSQATPGPASELAKANDSYHYAFDIQSVVTGLLNL